MCHCEPPEAAWQSETSLNLCLGTVHDTMTFSLSYRSSKVHAGLRLVPRNQKRAPLSESHAPSLIFFLWRLMADLRRYALGVSRRPAEFIRSTDGLYGICLWQRQRLSSACLCGRSTAHLAGFGLRIWSSCVHGGESLSDWLTTSRICARE